MILALLLSPVMVIVENYFITIDGHDHNDNMNDISNGTTDDDNSNNNNEDKD